MAALKYLICFLYVMVSSSVQCRTIVFDSIAPSVNQTSATDQEQAQNAVAVTPYFETPLEVKLPPPADVALAGGHEQTQIGKSRCGNKDIVPKYRLRRSINGNRPRWNKQNLTYRVVNGAKTLSKERVETLVAKAFAMWSPHCGLQFKQVDSGHADITISFEKRDHSDGFPFDGTYGVAGHAFDPPYGMIHFDDDENWIDIDQPHTGYALEFFGIALHEIGHALGLPHLSPDSVMYIHQSGARSLHTEDILAMRELYLNGKPYNPTTPVPTQPPVVEHEVDFRKHFNPCAVDYGTLKNPIDQFLYQFLCQHKETFNDYEYTYSGEYDD